MYTERGLKGDLEMYYIILTVPNSKSTHLHTTWILEGIIFKFELGLHRIT